MLVIIASSHDHLAEKLVSQWASHDAQLLTSDDLSRRGWRHQVLDPLDDIAVINGQIVPVHQIQGVLTCIPAIYAQDVLHIVRQDRAYVANEMTAFLLSWLTRLSCPVLNRPMPGCLAGPAWQQAQWIHVAAGLGIPVQPQSCCAGTSSFQDDEASVQVTVVGTKMIGKVEPLLAAQARRLADAAHIDLLTVSFRRSEAGPQFVTADPWPDLTEEGIADALLTYFTTAHTS